MRDVEGLVVRGRSAYHLRDVRFVFALAAGSTVLQMLIFPFLVDRGLVDALLLPFGFCTLGFLAVGGVGYLIARRSWCCRTCQEGLEDSDWVADAAEEAYDDVYAALERRDVDAVVATIQAHPREDDGPRFIRVHTSFCPACCNVAVVSVLSHARLLHPGRDSGEHAVSGAGVRSLLDISTTFVG